MTFSFTLLYLIIPLFGTGKGKQYAKPHALWGVPTKLKRMDIIAKNPYRYLGVYANSPTKDRVANQGKMNAFLKVGKPVSFPLDLPGLLSPIDRTVATVADANAKLTLPVDQLKYAQFWWLKSTSMDEIAFNHLMGGNASKAQSIWEKKDCASSLQNRVVLALANKDYPTALRCAETLYGNYDKGFMEMVMGSVSTVSVVLWQSFLDTLMDGGVSPDTLLTNVADKEWGAYIGEKSIEPIIAALNNAVAAAKASRGKGPAARLAAGNKLMADTKPMLSKLQGLLPKTDVRYQTLLDKLSQEILQCGIDYYNDTEDVDAPQRAMTLQKYALTIAVGSVVKGRCQENVKTLENIISKLPPMEVMVQFRSVQEEIRKFCQLPEKISHSINLLNATKPHLISIKNTIGGTNPAYLKLSTQVVSNALHNVIEEVNRVQNNLIVNKEKALLNIKSVLSTALCAIKLMYSFDMEADFKQNRLDPNRDILDRMYIDICRISPSPSSDTEWSNEEKWGCVVCLILIIVFIFSIIRGIFF